MSLVIKRFTASWCGPCRVLGPVMESVSREFSNVQFDVIDIDENRDLAMKYNVRSVPTVVFEKDGVEIDRFVGSRPAHQIISQINESL